MLRLVKHQNSHPKCHLYNSIWQDLQQSTAPGIQTVVKDSSVTQSCPTLCNLMDCSTPGFPAHHQLLELTQTQVHQVGDAIQPFHPLSSLSPPAFNLSQHRDLFQCQFFTSGSQSIGISASASVLLINIQGWWTDLQFSPTF